MPRPYADLSATDRSLADYLAFLAIDNFIDQHVNLAFTEYHEEMFGSFVRRSLALCGLERLEREIESMLDGKPAAAALAAIRKVAAEQEAQQLRQVSAAEQSAPKEPEAAECQAAAS